MTEAATNTMWKALRDIQGFGRRISGKVITAPKDQAHQRNKEDRRED